MDAVQRSWGLVKQSLAVVAKDKELLLFPLISGMLLILLDGPFLPLLERLRAGGADLSAYGLLFLLYCASYFVILFFNSALMAAVAIRLDGKDPTVGDGLRTAGRWIVEILAWAIIATTVGVLINALEDRIPIARRLIGRLLETAWSLATFFIVPVIIFEGLNDVRALRRSAELFRRQWGTEVVGQLGFGAVFLAFAIPAVLATLLVAAVSPTGAWAVGAFCFLVLYLVHEAAEAVFVVALYRYAASGTSGYTFAPEILQGAFARKRA